MAAPTSAGVPVNNSIKDEVGYQSAAKARKTQNACLFSHAVSLNTIGRTSGNNFHYLLNYYQFSKTNAT